MADLLESADYQRIVNVLDAAAGAVGHMVFFDQIRDALALHFGWRNAVVTSVPAEPDACPHHGALARDALDRPPGHPVRRGTAVLMGVVDGEPAGKAIIFVHFADGTVPGARESAVLSRLQRHLAPWLREHLIRSRAEQRFAALTDRELAVVILVARGMSNRQAAEHLRVTVDTVKKHLTRAMAKTGCASRTQLALQWVNADLSMEPPSDLDRIALC
jgi:DNA-binding CsgD family transcriptional regulator